MVEEFADQEPSSSDRLNWRDFFLELDMSFFIV